MKTFCIAYFNGHAGELTQHIVHAIDAGVAVIEFLCEQGYDTSEFNGPEAEFLDFCCNCDIWVEATDLTNVKIL